jgi:hypothetical protein
MKPAKFVFIDMDVNESGKIDKTCYNKGYLGYKPLKGASKVLLP